jgi:hypothetical protein
MTAKTLDLLPMKPHSYKFKLGNLIRGKNISWYPLAEDILNPVSQLSYQLQFNSWKFRLISVILKRMHTT